MKIMSKNLWLQDLQELLFAAKKSIRNVIWVFIFMIDETVFLGENTFVVVCLYDFQSKITSSQWSQ